MIKINIYYIFAIIIGILLIMGFYVEHYLDFGIGLLIGGFLTWLIIALIIGAKNKKYLERQERQTNDSNPA